MNSNDYFKILGDHVQPVMDFYFSNGNGIFQDDNALGLEKVALIGLEKWKIGLKHSVDHFSTCIGCPNALI